MNVLLIAPKFYNYHLRIKEELEQQGNKVDLFCEYREKYFLFTRFVSSQKKEQNNLKIQKSILKYIGNKKYDIVLVIVGRFITKYFIENLKQQQQQAKFVLYLWDDVDRCQSFEIIKSYFDKISSFDRKDCLKYSFEFLPLFYSDEYKPDSSIKKDISVYGAFFAHSDRLKIINKIAPQTENGFYYVYISSKIQYLKYKFQKLKNHQIHLTTKSIKEHENIKNMQKSTCILDIQHPSQTGLTIRTIEAIGCHKKIITTNGDIVNYDFYDPDNILVIDRDKPLIPQNFLKKEYRTLNRKIYENYSIHSFIRKLISTD